MTSVVFRNRRTCRVAALAICILGSASLFAEQASGRAASGLQYEPPLPESAKTQVLVLGTPHLGAMKTPPPPAALEPLLAVLTRFHPAVIGVERIPPDILLSMQQRGEFMAEVAQQFGGRYLDAGRKMQTALGISAADASKRVNALLQNRDGLDANARLQLVACMLAAYDYDSAVLQWSYVPDSARHSDAVASLLPADIAAAVDKSLHSPNEASSIAVTLAGRLGLQQIVPIDDQSDAVIAAEIMERFPGELEKIEQHRETKALRESASRAHADAEFEAGRSGPAGLLPYYRFINSPQATGQDVAGQWGRYFRTNLPSGVDRSRVAQWEVRNLLIAAHIRQATALHPGERMLVVIGSAHKPFLDRYLRQMLDVRVIQLESLIEKVGQFVQAEQ